MTHHVYRWHSHADPRLRDSKDTIEGHQIKVTGLCHALAAHLGHHAYEGDLLHAARHHDEAEKVLGDMPGPAKERFPALAEQYAVAEAQVLREMGYDWRLTEREADILCLCDRLDAWQWATGLGVTGPEWGAARDKLRRRAHAIGPDAVVWLEMQLTRAATPA